MRVVLEALIGRMERTDPTKEEQGLVRTSPSTPSPPGAWVNQLTQGNFYCTYIKLPEGTGILVANFSIP